MLPTPETFTKAVYLAVTDDKYRDENELSDRSSNPSRNPSALATNPSRSHTSVTNGDIMSQLQRKDYASRNPVTSFTTSSKPALRDTTSSFATQFTENTTGASNMTNLTDPRAIRETERRFLNDTPAIAPYRSASEGHRPLLPESQPVRLTHVDVRVPSNYHGGSATSTGSSNYMGTGIDRHLSNSTAAVIPRHTSAATNNDRRGGLVTGTYQQYQGSNSSSSGEHRVGRTYPESATSSQGGLTSSNTTFTIPSSSKATIRSLKSQLQKDKGLYNIPVLDLPNFAP